MSRHSRKVPAKIKKQRAQLAAAADREKDTIFWLVFEPRPEFAPPTNEERNLSTDPWRVRLWQNPKNNPEVIEAAIREFERNRGIKSWQEVAVRHYVDSFYFP
jgi:hypothetical protein